MARHHSGGALAWKKEIGIDGDFGVAEGMKDSERKNEWGDNPCWPGMNLLQRSSAEWKKKDL
jgi:hypothetical protein